MNIEIVRPAPGDARGIATVLYKTWLAAYPNAELGITKGDIVESYRNVFSDEQIKKSEERLRNISPQEKRVVAKDGHMVVGMATLVRNAGHNQLQTIYVLPEYQGKGVGMLLWEAVCDSEDLTKDTIVHVADYNLQAIKFYEKIGFVDTGKRWTDEKWKMRSGAHIPEMEMILARRSRS